MSTRYLTIVIKNGKPVIAQYGNSDGYISGYGVEILKFFRNCDLRKFRTQVDDVFFLTDEGLNEIKAKFGIPEVEEDFDYTYQLNYNALFEEYPHLQRSYGCNVLEFIHKNIINEDDRIGLLDSYDFVNEPIFCEYAYVIDLDRTSFEVYKGCRSVPSSTERFATINYPCKIDNSVYYMKFVTEYDLENLPSVDDFVVYCVSKLTKIEQDLIQNEKRDVLSDSIKTTQ